MQKLIELLAPASCVSCGDEGDWLCARCTREHIRVAPPACYRCERLTPLGVTCSACTEPGGISRVSAAAVYQGGVKELVRVLKFKRGRSAAGVAARLILAQLPEVLEIDLVTAVPISPARARERGYNQSELIARLIARNLGVPYANTMIRASSDHQIGRGRHERLAAMRGVFSPIRNLSGARVLLIDDVLTTGATIAECAAVLSATGASEVQAATLARR